MLWILSSIAFMITYYFTSRAIAYSFSTNGTADMGDWAFGGSVGLACMCVAPVTMCIIVFYYIDKGYIKTINAHRKKIKRIEREKTEQEYRIQELERILRIGEPS